MNATGYERYFGEFERSLSEACARMSFQPAVLTESMRYSLLLGGKRIRPVLFLSTLSMYGADYRKEMPLALAIECIHTYSLIHDDLPAMDNDDFRRGKASNHKTFGEANAILAGDALLSYAFDLLLEQAGRGERHLRAARTLSEAAGAAGMIAGQSADLLYTGKSGGEEELDFIYRHKTGKLIAAPVVMASEIAGADTQPMRRFGEALGALFQLTDDILDVKGNASTVGKTLGKDETEDKLTAVKVYGLERAEALKEEYAERCYGILSQLAGVDTQFHREIVALVMQRNL